MHGFGERILRKMHGLFDQRTRFVSHSKNNTKELAICAGNRGAAAPLEIFWPPLGDLRPPSP